MGQRFFARRQMQILMQIAANYTLAELGFCGRMAMEGAAWFALFSTVFLACQGRGQGNERRNYGSTSYCPQTNFLPSIPAPEAKHCDYSRDCSKIDCVVRQDPHKLRVMLKLNTCKVPWNATVTLKQQESNLNWSATLKDGEKAKLDVIPSMLTGGIPVSNDSFFVRVGLGKHGEQLLDYTVELLGNLKMSDVVIPVNVTLLSGSAPLGMTICDAVEVVHGEDHSEHYEEHPNVTKSCQPDKTKPNLKEGTCPPVCLTGGTLCPVTNHCSKITCTAPPQDKGPGMKKLTIELNGCRDVQTATVTIQSSKPFPTWSHTFKNGDRAVAPMSSGVGVKVRPYLKVELVKEKASIMFKLVLEIEERGSNRITTNTTALSAKLPLPKCGGSKSYKKHMPVYVKVVVIVIPVLLLLLVGLGFTFYCYRKSGSGLRFPVHLTPAGSKVPMRRLSNEI